MKIKEHFVFKLKHKFLICFYAGMVLITLILGIYFSQNLHKQVNDKAGAAGLSLVKQVSGSMEFLLQELYDASNLIFLDENVRDLLEEARGKNEWTNSSFQGVNISNFIITKSYISTLSIYNDVGLPIYAISTDNTFEKREVESSKEKEIIEEAKSARGKPIWFAIDSYEQTFFNQNSKKKIGMCRMIKNRDLTDIAGYIVVTINQDTVNNICTNFPIEDASFLALTDDQGNLLFQKGVLDMESSDIFLLAEGVSGSLPINLNHKEMILSYTKDSKKGFYFFYLFPTINAQQEFWDMAGYLLILIFFCILLSIPIAVAVSVQFTIPMKKLLRSMESFQNGNFEEQVDIHTKDEIGILASGFNKMVRNIDSLIKNNYILQFKEKEAEFTALQAQINPHFLYNTLEMIYWEAEEHREEEISEMVLNLSKFFRLSLNQGNAYTTVKKETELVQSYLALQQKRFEDRLFCTITVEPSAMEFSIPKLILQPFVENAVLHGFENKIGRCELKIHIFKQEHKIIILVKDNGAGMSQNQIDSLIRPHSVSGSYAVSNVIDRLGLIYGDQYFFNIQSSLGSGTQIEIHLPNSIE